MEEALQLVALQWGAVLTFTAAGLGIAIWLLPRTEPARLAWAPLLGAALLLALAASAATQVPSRESVWLVLLPVLVLSLIAFGLALGFARGGISGTQIGEIGWVGVAMVPAFLLSAGPYVVAGTAGPLNLYATDSWFWYLPMAHFLQDSAIGEAPPPGYFPPQLSIAVLLGGGVRIGFDALHAAYASFVDVRLDKTLAPFVGAAYMTVSGAVYCLARTAAGLRRWWALLAATLTGSSTLLGPVFETSGPSVFAYGLVPAGLWFAWIGMRGESWRHVLAAGVLLAGLIGVYSEAIPVFLLGGGLLTLIALVKAASGSPSRPAGARAAARVLAWAVTVAVVAVVISPPSSGRAIRYLRHIKVEVVAPQDWGLTNENLAVWSLGVEHLYEARRFATTSVLTTTLAYAFAALIAGVVLLGIVRSCPRLRPWLLAGVASTLAVAIYTGVANDCNYCLYRAWIFSAPFLVIAAVVGLQAIAKGAVRSRLRLASAAVAAVIPVLLVGVLARSSIDLAVAARGARTFTDASLRNVTATVEEHGDRRPVLVEGSDSGFPITPFFWSNALMQLVADGGARPVISPVAASWVQGGSATPDTTRVPDDYGLVVTRFGGVQSGRRTLGDAGRYVVQRRAPIDVSVQPATTAWAVDEDVPGRDAIPWLSSAVDLVVSSPRAATIGLRLDLVGPQAPTTTLTAESAGRPLAIMDLGGGNPRHVCIAARVRPGATTVRMMPTLDPPVPPAGYVQPDQAIPDLPEQLGIAAIEVTRATPGRNPCARRGPSGS